MYHFLDGYQLNIKGNSDVYVMLFIKQKLIVTVYTLLDQKLISDYSVHSILPFEHFIIS